MSSLRRRGALLAASSVALAAASLATASPASAHTCAQVDVYTMGDAKSVGSCHTDGIPGPGDICAGSEVAPVGTGVGFTVCVRV